MHTRKPLEGLRTEERRVVVVQREVDALGAAAAPEPAARRAGASEFGTRTGAAAPEQWQQLRGHVSGLRPSKGIRGRGAWSHIL